MKTVDLNKVLEMLINEEQNEATGLLHEWFVERSKQIHEELMSEDNTLSQDIEDDQEAIESEEFYGEADEDTDAEGEEELDGDVDAGDEIEGDDTDGDMEGPEDLSPEASIGDTIEDLEAVMARLKAEFATITGADVAGDEVAGDEFGDEEVDEAFDAKANDHVFTKREPKFAAAIMDQYNHGTEDGELPHFTLDNGVDVEGGWILASGAIGMNDQQISARIAKNIGINPTAIADKIGKVKLANGMNAVYAAFVVGGDLMKDGHVDEAFDAKANDHVFTRREPKFAKSIMDQYNMGAEDGELPHFTLDNGVDVEGGWFLASAAIEMDDQQIATTIAKQIGLNPTAIADKVGRVKLANGMNAVYAAFVIGGDQMKDGHVDESADDFDDLEESWTLEPVKDPNLQGGKEIGANGAKVNLNDKSPLPEHDADARVGGRAVEIKSDHHEGHEREASPEVKGRPLLKNQVKKATDGRTKVSKEGDKSAQLNSKAGFGSDSPKSPIGQATDLRGSDFKRK